MCGSIKSKCNHFQPFPFTHHTAHPTRQQQHKLESSPLTLLARSLFNSKTPIIDNLPTLLRVEVYPEMAEAFKQQGNALFAKGDYAGAVEQYTNAIAKCSEADTVMASKLFSNRALCNLKLGNNPYAEADATAALCEDSSNIKALRHRGMARCNIDGQQELAIADLEQFVESGGKIDKSLVKTLKKLKGGVDALSQLTGESKTTVAAATKATKTVAYTVEKVGEGEIFDVWKVQFQVPRQGLDRLSGGRASVQVRGGSFELVANPASGCVETTIETPDPKPAADAIAERIYLRINSSDTFSGMDACVVM